MSCICAPAVAQNGSGPGDTPAASKEKPRKEGRSWGKKAKKKKWGRTLEIDVRTGNRLTDAREQLLDEQYDDADATLDRLRMRSLNDLEKLQVYRIRAYIENGRENYPGAREYLQKILAIEDEDVLQHDDRTDLLYMVAQLYLQEQDWAAGAKTLEQWFESVDEPNSGAYYLLAITYYQLDDLDKAVVPAQKAVDIAENPQESWLQLLLALRLTDKDYPRSVVLLDTLLERFPKKVYWMQLSTVHAAMGNFEKALVPLQLAYIEGLLDRSEEIRRLAELMLYLEQPYRSAKVLSKALAEERIEPDVDTFELLSNSWIAAREYEKAVDPLQRAAELSKSGEIFVRLAQVHIQREKWTDAEQALRRALEKGGLPNAGDAQLLMGITFYSQKRPEQALTWFHRAEQHPQTNDEAQNWVKFIERELTAAAG